MQVRKTLLITTGIKCITFSESQIVIYFVSFISSISGQRTLNMSRSCKHFLITSHWVLVEKCHEALLCFLREGIVADTFVNMPTQ